MKKLVSKLIVGLLVVCVMTTVFACKEAVYPIEDINGVKQYVLDITDEANWERQKALEGSVVWLTSSNCQIIFDSSLVNLDTINVAEPLKYWQSVVGFLDGVVYGEGFNREDKIVFEFDASLEGLTSTDLKTGRIRLNPSLIATFLEPKTLIKSGGYTVFFELGRVYSTSSEGTPLGFVLNNNISMSANVFALMLTSAFTDMVSRAYVGGVYSNERFLKPSYAMEIARSVDSTLNSFSELDQGQRLSMFVLMLQRFGAEKMRRLFSSYVGMTEQELLSFKEDDKEDELLVRSSEILGYDMREFFDYFKMHKSYETWAKVEKMKNPTFYPVVISGIGGDISLKMSEGRFIELDVADGIMMLFGEAKLSSLSFDRGVKSLDKPILSDTAVGFMPSVGRFDRVEVIVKTPSEAVRIEGGFRSVLSDDEIVNDIRYDYTVNEVMRLGGGNIAADYPLYAILAIKIALPSTMLLATIIIIIIAIKKHPKKIGRTIVR